MSIGPISEYRRNFSCGTQETLGEWATEFRESISKKLTDPMKGWEDGQFEDLSTDFLVQTDWLSMLNANFENEWHNFEECNDPTEKRWKIFDPSHLAVEHLYNDMRFSGLYLSNLIDGLGYRENIHVMRERLYKRLSGSDNIGWREKKVGSPYQRLLNEINAIIDGEIHYVSGPRIRKLPNWSQHVLQRSVSIIDRCDVINAVSSEVERLRSAILAGAIPCDIQKRNGEERLVVFWIHPFPPRGWEDICKGGQAEG